MELKKALEIRAQYDGIDGTIRIDADEYICLNEMASFFPGQRLDDWLRNESTKRFISIVEKNIIPGKSGIIAKRGKGGGTWSHHLIAFEFATWLSPEFKLKVYREYIEGTQNKKNWNIKRIIAAEGYKILTKSVKDAHEKPAYYHYSNEALLLNEIVFGVREGDVRDTATEKQLDDISRLEWHDATLNELGYTYDQRKKILKQFYDKMNVKEPSLLT